MIKIESRSLRIVFIAAGVFSIGAALLVAKWGFGHTAATGPDSIEVAVLAADLGPDDPQAHYAAAVLYEKTFVTEDLQKALTEFETATALSPNNYLLWLSLGRARERNGDPAGAESALRKALELAPNYSRIQWTLGNVLLRQGKTDEAFAEIRKAVAGDQDYTNAAAAMAWQVLDGNMTQVRNAIGDSARLNAALAILLAEQKRFDESFEIWNALPAEEKETTLKDSGDTLFRKFVEAGSYRLASLVMAQIRGPTNTDELVGEISNGGFESPVKTQNAGIFEWRIAEGLTPRVGPTDGQKRSGTYSLLMSFGQDSKDFRQVSHIVAVEPGRNYELEVFYRSDLKTTAAIKWEIADAANGKLIAATNAVVTTTDWIPIRAMFLVPENIDGIVIRLVREDCSRVNCTISGNLWFDDFTLKSR